MVFNMIYYVYLKLKHFIWKHIVIVGQKWLIIYISDLLCNTNVLRLLTTSKSLFTASFIYWFIFWPCAFLCALHDIIHTGPYKKELNAKVQLIICDVKVLRSHAILSIGQEIKFLSDCAQSGRLG